jgi:Trk K+ transport system NAD-binding subunit
MFQFSSPAAVRVLARRQRAMAAKGAKVAVIDMNKDGAEAVAKEIGGLALVGDVSEEAP